MFLIPVFEKYMGKVDIIGTASSPKGFICHGNYFFDTNLIFKGSLSNLSK